MNVADLLEDKDNRKPVWNGLPMPSVGIGIPTSGARRHRVLITGTLITPVIAAVMEILHIALQSTLSRQLWPVSFGTQE
jgi:hypothetical protein